MSQPLPQIAPMPPCRAGDCRGSARAGVAQEPDRVLPRDAARPRRHLRRRRVRLPPVLRVLPGGRAALYALPEAQASFGLATYDRAQAQAAARAVRRAAQLAAYAVRRGGCRALPRNLEAASRLRSRSCGSSGAFEVFAEMRRLGHRLGLAVVDRPGSSVAALPRPPDPAVRSPRQRRARSVRPAQAFVTCGDAARPRARRDARDRSHGRRDISGRERGTPRRGRLPRADLRLLRRPRAGGARRRRRARRHHAAPGLAVEPVRSAGVDVRQRRPRARDLARGAATATTCCSSSAPTSRSGWRSARSRSARCWSRVDFDDERRIRTVWPPGVLITTMLSVNNTTAPPGLDALRPPPLRRAACYRWPLQWPPRSW